MNSERYDEIESIVKRRKLFIFLGIISLITMLSALVYFTSSNNVKVNPPNTSGDSNINVDDSKEKKDEIKSTNIANDANEAITKLSTIYVNNDKLYNNFNIKDIDKSELIISAINALDRDKINGLCEESTHVVSVTIKELNDALSKVVYGKTLTIEDIKSSLDEYGDVKLNTPRLKDAMFKTYGIKFNEDNIEIYSSCGYEGLLDNIYTNINKIENDEEYLYIYENIVFGKVSDRGDDIYYDYYKDYNTTNKVETLLSGDEKFAWNKYVTYKITFKYINNTYYFESIEEVA